MIFYGCIYSLRATIHVIYVTQIVSLCTILLNDEIALHGEIYASGKAHFGIKDF